MNQQDLGPLEAWQLRAFPRELRQAVINAAKERRLSPGEFVTAILVKVRDAGWDHFATPQSPAANGPGIDDLAKLAVAAQRVADRPIACRKGCARDCSGRYGKLRGTRSHHGRRRRRRSRHRTRV